jgi:hypothetical protein
MDIVIAVAALAAFIIAAVTRGADSRDGFNETAR